MTESDLLPEAEVHGPESDPEWKPQLMLTPDHRYSFIIREDSSVVVYDGVLVRETWVENVYQIHKSDFDGTGVLVDIGANIGTVSVYGASLGAKVIAVEPEPENVRILHENIRRNHVTHQVTVMQTAVHFDSGEGYMTPNRGNGALVFEELPGSTPTSVMTLAELLDQAGVEECDVCKIDVEGSEAYIIAGASLQTLRRIRYLTMEFDGTCDDVAWGLMVTKIAKYGNTHIIGSPERGGYIYSRRY